MQLVAGNVDGAVETQKKCLRTINDVANGIPVIGHVKGKGHSLSVNSFAVYYFILPFIHPGVHA